MGCSSCASKARRNVKVNRQTNVTKAERTKEKKPKPVTKFMHVKTSGVNMRRAFSALQARAQKRVRRKEKQI